MLEFERIRHAYNGSLSVCDVSFQVQPGEVVSLLGPSGCGKTTLLRLAAGLEQPRHGSISLHGDVISSADYIQPPEQRGIGYMFQDYALFPRSVGRVERQRGDRWRRTRCWIQFSRIFSFRWTGSRNLLLTSSQRLCCQTTTLASRRLRRSVLSISTLARTSPRRRRWLDQRQRTKRFVSLTVKRSRFEWTRSAQPR